MQDALLPPKLFCAVSVRRGSSDDHTPLIEEQTMGAFGGRPIEAGLWSFTAASTAVQASLELFIRLGQSAFISIVTGETRGGRAESDPGERAGLISSSAKSPRVVVCDATQRIAASFLPSEYWLEDLGRIPVLPIGVEHLFSVRKGAAGEVAPVAGCAGPRNPASFVGRAIEIEEIADLLSAWFLVTITGPTGIGKSALAVEVVRRIERQYGDGVFWIDCERCHDESDLLKQLQRRCGSAAGPDRAAFQELSAELSRLNALVVLDNCEHLCAAARKLIESTIAQSTTIGFLVTSTIVLNSMREHVYRLGPMSLPRRSEEHLVVSRFDSDAVALFAERAQEVRASFTLNSENVVQVADVCRLLGGNPLGIEIAASRLGCRRLGRLLEREEEILKVQMAAPPRRPHQISLIRSWGRSFDALAPELQTVLVRLSLFRGAFSEDDVLAVLAEEDRSLNLTEAIDRLVESSWLLFVHDTGLYELPAIGRIFLRSLGYPTEPDQRRYANRVLGNLERAGRLFDALQEDAAVSLIESRYDDILFALRVMFRLSGRRGDYSAHFTTLSDYWVRRDMFEDAEAFLVEAIADVELNPPDAARVRQIIGTAQYRRRDLRLAEESFKTAISLLDANDTDEGMGHAYTSLCKVYSDTRQFDRGIDCANLAIELLKAEGEVRHLSDAYISGAQCLIEWTVFDGSHAPEGNLERAKRLLHEAERLVGDGMPFRLQAIYQNLGELELLSGNDRIARGFYIRAALLCERAGTEPEVVRGLERLAAIESRHGQSEHAAKLLGAAIHLRVTHSKQRRERDQLKFDELLGELARNLGIDRVEEYMKFGSISGISDLCVP